MFRLPFLFIVTGLCSFMLYHLFTLVSLAGWIAIPPRNPAGWSNAHLLVLGWGTMVAMGAVYQLISVILQQQRYSVKLGYFHYAFFTAGAAGLIAGFRLWNIPLLAGSGCLAFIGILLFVINIGMALKRANVWNPVTVSASCALAYLLLAGVLGMTMGLNFAFDFADSMHLRLLAAHIWLGTVGWFGMLISGFSYKMLTMFFLSHGQPVKLQKWIALLWNISVVAGAAGFLLTGSMWAFWGALLPLGAALILYVMHIGQLRKHKHKKSPGIGILWAVRFAWGITGAVLLLIVLLPFIPSAWSDRLLQIAGWTYIWGWVALSILGYLSKIVPFLWWTHKYGDRAGKEKVPMMSDLIDERKVNLLLICLAGSLVVLLAGLIAGVAAVSAVGGVVLSLGSLAYAVLIGRVFAK